MVKAQEVLPRHQPAEPPKQPVQESRKQRDTDKKLGKGLLIGGGTLLAGAAAIAGLTALRNGPSSQPEAPRTPLTQPETISPTTKEPVINSEAQRAEENIKEFFAMTDEEFQTWGTDNVFEDIFGPWAFPVLPPGKGTLVEQDGKPLHINLGLTGANKVEPQPSLFYTYFNSREKLYQILGANLGIVTVPLGEVGVEDTYLLVGLKTQREFGSKSIIMPVLISRRDDANPLSRDETYSYFFNKPLVGEHKFIDNRYQVHDVHSDRNRVERDLLNKRLNESIGHPVKILISEGSIPSTSGDSNVELLSPHVNELHASTQNLFSGNNDLYFQELEEFAREGLVILENNPSLPNWVTEGLNSPEDSSNHAASVAVSFFQNSHPLPLRK